MTGVPQSQSQSQSRSTQSQSQTQTQTQTGPVRVPSDRWRLQVVHRTQFRYGGPVRSSYNEARMTPESSSRQTTLRSRVEIEPAATVHAYRDYWGSTVTAFDTHGPHTELIVKATSVVEAGPEP
ncbi:MAG: putative transglutaminase, partial [Modestobacter sp.]|nr:putative transglutaminase [Modestobacter sp.]